MMSRATALFWPSMLAVAVNSTAVENVIPGAVVHGVGAVVHEISEHDGIGAMEHDGIGTAECFDSSTSLAAV